MILIMVGFLLTGLIGKFGYTIAWVGVGFMLFAVLFQVVTLPVEFDASKRALEQVVDLNIVDEQEIDIAVSFNSCRINLCSSSSSCFNGITKICVYLVRKQ